MRSFALVGALMAAALTGAPGMAQQSGFEDEVLRRLDRLERRIDALERDLDRERERADSGYSRREPERSEVVAAVTLMCGADCGMQAARYCRNAGFARGVALEIEKRNGFDNVTRARCFN
jgi:hypothetical protein